MTWERAIFSKYVCIVKKAEKVWLDLRKSNIPNILKILKLCMYCIYCEKSWKGEIRFEKEQYSASDNPLNLAHKLQTASVAGWILFSNYTKEIDIVFKLYKGYECFFLLNYTEEMNIAFKLYKGGEYFCQIIQRRWMFFFQIIQKRWILFSNYTKEVNIVFKLYKGDECFFFQFIQRRLILFSNYTKG